MPIKQPTTTPCPDEIIDHLMADLSGAELKCLLYIVRHTFGYGKHITGDTISLEQFQHGIRRKDTGEVVDRGTGLASRSTITNALSSLEAKGLIKRVYRTSAAGDADATLYMLDVAADEAIPHPPLAAAAGAEGSPKTGLPPTTGSPKTGPPTSEGSPKTGLPAPKGSPQIVRPPAQGSPIFGLQVVQKLDPQQTTIQEIPVVPTGPGVMSNKGDTSARNGVGDTSNARAREGTAKIMSMNRANHEEQPLPRAALDPRPEWVLEIGQQIQEHWGGSLLASEREEWREWVWQNLHDEDPAQRARFLAYAFANNRIPQLSSPRGVLTFLSKDLDSWRRSDRPTTKGLWRVEGGRSSPTVPVHVQRERALAYNPKTGSRPIDATSDPEEIAATLADLRKYEGEDSAQRWLRSIMAASEGA